MNLFESDQPSWIYPVWSLPAGVHAVVTTRQGPGISVAPYDHFNLGLRSGDLPEAVNANRDALQQVLRLPSPPRWLAQVHGADVAELGPLPALNEPEIDAAVAHLPGTVLTILSADCLPVLFCAADGCEIAAAHAGWRGLAAGVLEATLKQMVSPPSSVQAWLGPCIGMTSYEVGAEVYAAFVDDDVLAAGCFVPTRPGHWLCDLASLARRRLQASGVQQIHGGGFDTSSDTRLYSYRRDGARSGRFASLIWIDAVG